MNIYVAHSTSFDFKRELYAPLRSLDDYDFIFPHENATFTDSKSILRSCDLVLAEVSYPSTGLGIELGWADILDTPIICIYKTGASVSSSLATVSDVRIEYSSTEDMLQKLNDYLASSVRQ